VARIDDILNRINETAPVVVDLASVKEETIRCKAVLIKKDLPLLELVFLPNSWDIDDLKIGGNCNMVIEHKGETVNIIARLDRVAGPRRLHFTAREPIAPESLRDYFRVSTNLPIEASYIAGPLEVNAQTWKMYGTTIDLSGSGVLALFPGKPPSNKRIQLIITVPDGAAPIVSLANVIKSYRLRQNKYQVAFHFETFNSDSQDKIIACCFELQRRNLRMRAQAGY
jgi:c-di-GMP-binding flagellar brake protein YcgR